MFDNSSSPHNGLAHFSFQINEKNYIYAYIRKNACTTLKIMSIKNSIHKNHLSNCRSEFHFLKVFHSAPLLENSNALSFFIYRDPLERIISLYVNKFIVMSGYEDIYKDVYDKIKEDPMQLTFHNFVFNYLGANYPHVDVHCISQYEYLRPIKYNYAIDIKYLYNTMIDIIGLDYANLYFRNETNKNPDRTDLINFSHVTAKKLRQIYMSNNVLPSYKSLINSYIIDKINSIYLDDYKLIDKIKKSNSA